MPNINISIKLELYEKLKELKQIGKYTNYTDVIKTAINEAKENKTEIDADLKIKIKNIVEEFISEKQQY